MLKPSDLLKKKNPYQPYILLFSGILFFLPFLGAVHLFDWDEINFAESAREMLISGNYTVVQINYQPFWEKPPLFFWLQVVSMKMWGVSEFAARFPNAIFGIITLLTLYYLGKRLHDARMGMIWALVYFGSFLPHLYFKSGIIDPVFNFFIFLSVVYLYRSASRYPGKSALRHAILAGLFSGLAVLTKGPVGFLLLLLTFLSYWVWSGFRKVSNLKNILAFALTFTLVTTVWFGWETIKNGPWFLVEFIQYQIRLFTTPDAGHKQPFFYHFVVVLLGCFPLSIFALPSFRNEFISERGSFRKWMLCLFWVVMILFSIAETKIVHYSSMAYLPLSYLAARYLYHLISSKNLINSGVSYVVLVIGLLFGLLLTALPLVVLYKDALIPLIKDPFAVGNLSVPVVWTGFESLIGFFFIVSVIVAYIFLRRQRTSTALLLLSYASAFTLLLYLIIVVPKIEAHSQRSAIEFYKTLQNKEVYVRTIGFKSYAQYYYSQIQPGMPQEHLDEQWLLNGPIDRPVYFVSKVHRKKKLEAYPEIKLLKEEGGFAFFKREVPEQP
ncbi:glycosyltransferase family 39 protein [Cytophagales bacterium LB-30]|uniref:Glycosyltransferase family 39 protein n=1 Tax=Shiella aurantiaca TaxID=3058365 RepID=A0ABT8F7U3_9BACT|nr:glycosyltransferase family 39 protein [Shiella aurantiaca]MDN4166558.1 glycosyltransferase family 39 protein [Shiella aurantiaca]